MTVPFVFLLIVAALIEVKMGGMQWPGMVLGAFIAKSLTAGSFLDNLLGQGVDVVEQVAVAVVDGLTQGNFL